MRNRIDLDSGSVVPIIFILFVIGLIVYGVLWTIDTEKYIVVESKHWESYAAWTEDYYATECDYDSQTERTECDQVRHTRTVCSRTMTGYELPVTYPELSCKAEDYKTNESFYIDYHVEDGIKRKTARTNIRVYGAVLENRSYIGTINLLGHIKNVE